MRTFHSKTNCIKPYHPDTCRHGKTQFIGTIKSEDIAENDIINTRFTDIYLINDKGGLCCRYGKKREEYSSYNSIWGICDINGQTPDAFFKVLIALVKQRTHITKRS